VYSDCNIRRAPGLRFRGRAVGRILADEASSEDYIGNFSFSQENAVIDFSVVGLSSLRYSRRLLCLARFNEGSTGALNIIGSPVLHLGRCFRVVQEARALAANHPDFMHQALHLSRSFLRPDDRFESVIFPSSLHATHAFGYWLGHKTERPKERRLVSFYAVED
jgi:hypothetical protein